MLKGLLIALYAIILGSSQDVSALSVQQRNQEVLQGPSRNGILAVRAALIKAEIIPTVLDDFIPSLILDAKWSSKTKSELGNTLKPKKLQDAPHITIREDGVALTNHHATPTNMTYTVVLTDPDAPSRDNPEWSEFCHWIATNVSLTSLEHDDSLEMLNHLSNVIGYKPPGPPPKTGKHRYVFIAFAPANMTSQPIHPSKPQDRQHWGTGEERHGARDWARENGLVAVAANFIYAQNTKQ